MSMHADETRAFKFLKMQLQSARRKFALNEPFLQNMRKKL